MVLWTKIDLYQNDMVKEVHHLVCQTWWRQYNDIGMYGS